MSFELHSSRPIWLQLAEQLGRRIVTGVYPPGSRFPTVRELAAEAGVNPNTMQRALTQLESRGLVTTNRTAGRTVTEDTAVLDAMRAQLARELTEKAIKTLHEAYRATIDQGPAATIREKSAEAVSVLVI